MTMQCPVCLHENIDGVAFCEACGHEFGSEPMEPIAQVDRIEEPDLSSDAIETTVSEIIEPVYDDAPVETFGVSRSNSSFSSAKLVAKSATAPVKAILLEEDSYVIGKFDPDLGPVDIDLEGFDGQDLISRTHARIFFENGAWQIEDLGSTNGVFIKQPGEVKFSPRIVEPQTLATGDEIAIAKIRFLFENA